MWHLFTISDNLQRTKNLDEEYTKLIQEASQSAKTKAQESSFQRKLNDVEDRVEEKVPLSLVTSVEGGGSALIEMASGMRDEIDHFAGGCTMLINALDAISTRQPTAALLAFKGVINLELKRRDNNQKVLALKVQMKSMMSALEPLGSIPNSHVAPDGTTLENRFKPLVAQMCKDVLECGNACDTYTKKRLIAKVLKSYIYEKHLAGFSERFAERRREIMLAISAHTTVVLTEVKDVLNANSQLMLQLFRRLDTPRERDIRQSVDERGGPGACMKDDYKLKQLMRMEDGAVVAGGDTEARTDLAGLKRELQESLGDSLEKNLTQFLGKLRALRDEVIGAIQNVETSIHREGDRVIADLTKGPHERILDQDIHELWREMHWRYSVKAHHFTFALRDHLIEKCHGMHGKDHVHRPQSDDAATEPTGSEGEVSHANIPQSDADGDRWAVEALTMLTVQPISEALDDDGTGFSELEVGDQQSCVGCASHVLNSLLHWLVYWGEGWYASLVDYRTKILRTMQDMYATLDKVWPINRGVVDEYLSSVAFRRIELLMRGLDLSRPLASADVLAKLRPYTQDEEARIEKALEPLNYEIGDNDALDIVTGQGRIERYIIPLLYLVLRRHLKIIKKGAACLLDQWQVDMAWSTLYQLVAAAEDRAMVLNGTYRATLQERWAIKIVNIRLWHDLRWSSSPKGNILRLYYQTDVADETSQVSDGQTTRTVEEEEVVVDWEYDTSGYDVPSDEIEPCHITDDGTEISTWTAPCYLYGELKLEWVYGLLSLKLSIDKDGIVSGSARSGFSNCTIDGNRTTDEDGAMMLRFKIVHHPVTWVSSLLTPITWYYEGKYLPATNSYAGVWRFDQDSTVKHISILASTPADIFHFRSIIEDDRTAASLWQFARAAVLHRVRRKMLSRKHGLERWREMKQYVDLHMRRVFSWTVSNGDALQPSAEMQEDLDRSAYTLPPEDERLYLSIVASRPTKPTYHCCKKAIVGDRYACLQCVSDGLRNQIDLCSDCSNQTPNSGSFAHKGSHTLLRLHYHLHDKDKEQVYDDASKALDAAKRLFSSTNESAISRLFPYSSCSSDRWFRSARSTDILTCDICRPRKHDAHHVWILVKKAAFHAELSSAVERLQENVETLSTRLAKLESIEDRLAKLESIESRMGALERMLGVALASRQ
ncbi:hypothetical protein FB107DRAFT_212592 [Schizophyllum commune]